MTEKIRKILKEADIRDVGFCSFDDVKDRLLSCRAMNRLPKNAKSVIVCLFPYKVKENPPENISRYAAVPDYHKVCGEILATACAELSKHIDGYQFEWFIDNSPIPEVYTAAKAGLGLVGENSLLITEKYGSFVFIGEIVTDLELEIKNNEIKHCTSCGLCKKVCPKTENIPCLSALSQKKGELLADEVEILKRNNIVWGCDICAEICPKNKNAEITYIEAFLKGYRNRFNIGESINDRAYEWRGEKTVTRNALLFKENKNEQN